MTCCRKCTEMAALLADWEAVAARHHDNSAISAAAHFLPPSVRASPALKSLMEEVTRQSRFQAQSDMSRSLQIRLREESA